MNPNQRFWQSGWFYILSKLMSFDRYNGNAVISNTDIKHKQNKKHMAVIEKGAINISNSHPSENGTKQHYHVWCKVLFLLCHGMFKL